MSKIMFTYHSTDPKQYSKFENGANAGTIAVDTHPVSNDDGAVRGARELNLKPGRYIAVQTASADFDDNIGYSYIIEVYPSEESVRIVTS